MHGRVAEGDEHLRPFARIRCSLAAEAAQGGLFHLLAGPVETGDVSGAQSGGALSEIQALEDELTLGRVNGPVRDKQPQEIGERVAVARREGG